MAFFKEREQKHKQGKKMFIHDWIVQNYSLQIMLDKKFQLEEKFQSYERYQIEKEKKAQTGGFIIVEDDSELTSSQVKDLKYLERYFVMGDSFYLSLVQKINF